MVSDAGLQRAAQDRRGAAGAREVRLRDDRAGQGASARSGRAPTTTRSGWCRPGVLQDYLASICDQEGVAVEPAVLPLVVRAGAGLGARRAVGARPADRRCGPDGRRPMRPRSPCSATPTPRCSTTIVDAFAAGDGAAVFRVVDRVVEGGHDPRRFVADLLDRLRDLIVLGAVPDAALKGLVTARPTTLERLSAQAARFGARRARPRRRDRRHRADRDARRDRSAAAARAGLRARPAARGPTIARRRRCTPGSTGSSAGSRSAALAGAHPRRSPQPHRRTDESRSRQRQPTPSRPTAAPPAQPRGRAGARSRRSPRASAGPGTWSAARDVGRGPPDVAARPRAGEEAAPVGVDAAVREGGRAVGRRRRGSRWPCRLGWSRASRLSGHDEIVRQALHRRARCRLAGRGSRRPGSHRRRRRPADVPDRPRRAAAAAAHPGRTDADSRRARRARRRHDDRERRRPAAEARRPSREPIAATTTDARRRGQPPRQLLADASSARPRSRSTTSRDALLYESSARSQRPPACRETLTPRVRRRGPGPHRRARPAAGRRSEERAAHRVPPARGRPGRRRAGWSTRSTEVKEKVRFCAVCGNVAEDERVPDLPRPAPRPRGDLRRRGAQGRRRDRDAPASSAVATTCSAARSARSTASARTTCGSAS